jgi:phosphate uptake regulator
MEARRIQVVGNRSFSVSLPKQWVVDNKLSQKKTVFITKTENDDLLIKKTDIGTKEPKYIHVKLEEISDISEFLVFCYVKNIEQIKIRYDRMYTEKVAMIRTVLKYLDGYDITAEDDSSITISFLFNDINITIQKILVRMIYLIKLELSACVNSDKVGIEEFEMNIDRLYNLSKRIIFACIRNVKLRKENKIMHDEDLFFYKDIFKRLEQIGDSVYYLSSLKFSQSDIELVSEMINILEQVIINKKKPHEYMTRIGSMKIESKDHDVRFAISKMNDRCKDLFDNVISIEFNSRYF